MQGNVNWVQWWAWWMFSFTVVLALKVKLLWFHCTLYDSNKFWLITIKCVGSFSSVSPSRCSTLLLLTCLGCSQPLLWRWGRGWASRPRLSPAPVNKFQQSVKQWDTWPTELTGRYISLPDTSPWWCRQRLPLRRRPPRQPVWPSRPWTAAGGPRRSALPPDGRSGQRWVCTSAHYRKKRSSCQMM